MGRSQPIWHSLSVVTAVMILMLHLPVGTAQPPPTPCPAPSSPFRPPGPNTVGLAWDGQKFWAAERGETESWIYYCSDPACNAWVKSFQWREGRLGAIAWGDRGLWVVDEQRRKIIFLELTRPASRLAKQVTIPPAALHQPPAITGLAWDGSTLWLVTGCGLCSSFYRIDQRDGRVMQSFFPRCEPRGLAFDGQYLWTIGYNGPGRQSLLSQRDLSDLPTSVLTHHFVLPLNSEQSLLKKPTAIAYARDNLWILDQADLGTIFSVSRKALLEQQKLLVEQKLLAKRWR